MWAYNMEVLMSGLPAFARTASVNMPHPKRCASDLRNQIIPYVLRHTPPQRVCHERPNQMWTVPSYLWSPDGWTGLPKGLDTEALWPAHPIGPWHQRSCAWRLAPAHLPALLLGQGFVTSLELSLLHRLSFGKDKKLIGTAHTRIILRYQFEMYRSMICVIFRYVISLSVVWKGIAEECMWFVQLEGSEVNYYTALWIHTSWLTYVSRSIDFPRNAHIWNRSKENWDYQTKWMEKSCKT